MSKEESDKITLSSDKFFCSAFLYSFAVALMNEI
jgi:hypothetical protein